MSLKPRRRGTADQLVAAASGQTVLDLMTTGERPGISPQRPSGPPWWNALIRLANMGCVSVTRGSLVSLI